MTYSYDWRGRGEVWPAKNRHAPDGEKERAGAAAGLASVTAPGALSKILFSSFSPLWKIPWRGAHRTRPSQKGDTGLWRGIAWHAWTDQQLHPWHLGKDRLDQRVGLCNLNSKASPAGYTGVFIHWAVGQAGSQEWDQNCYTIFFFQIWTYIQKNCSCHACLSFLLLSIILQTFGGRGGLYHCFQVLPNETDENCVRCLINRDE